MGERESAVICSRRSEGEGPRRDDHCRRRSLADQDHLFLFPPSELPDPPAPSFLLSSILTPLFPASSAVVTHSPGIDGESVQIPQTPCIFLSLSYKKRQSGYFFGVQNFCIRQEDEYCIRSRGRTLRISFSPPSADDDQRRKQAEFHYLAAGPLTPPPPDREADPRERDGKGRHQGKKSRGLREIWEHTWARGGKGGIPLG